MTRTVVFLGTRSFFGKRVPCVCKGPPERACTRILARRSSLKVQKKNAAITQEHATVVSSLTIQQKKSVFATGFPLKGVMHLGLGGRRPPGQIGPDVEVPARVTCVTIEESHNRAQSHNRAVVRLPDGYANHPSAVFPRSSFSQIWGLDY